MSFKQYFKLFLESLDSTYRTTGRFKTHEEKAEDEDSDQDYMVDKLDSVQIIKFVGDNGVRYLWYAKQNIYDDTTWEIAFGPIKEETPELNKYTIDIEKTRKGDAFKVFATVIEITNSFVEFGEHDVQRLLISSKEPNRTRLYINRLAPKIDRFEVTDVQAIHGDTLITMTRTY